MPRMVNRPSASVVAGCGPGRRGLGAYSRPRSGGLRYARQASGDRAGHGPSPSTEIATPGTGRPLKVEQPPLDHLLGPERDVGGGLIGVGVELDPADAVARRDGDGADLVMASTTRCAAASSRNRPEPSPSRLADRRQVRSPPTAGRVRCLSACVDHHRRVRHRLALRVEHAADDEHPARGRLRIRVVRLRGDRTWVRLSSLTSGLAMAGEAPAPVATAPRSSKVNARSFSLWISMDRSTSWARAVAEAETAPPAACPAAKWIAARVVMSHRRDETDAEADRGLRTAASAAAGSDDAAAGQAAAELLARPGQSAAERAGRPSEPSRRLVEGEALEVAEHDRQAEGVRQAVDLAVQGLGLLAVQDRLLGRLDRRLDRELEPDRTPMAPLSSFCAAASEPAAGLAGRAERHAVEPVAQQVGVADRPGLAGQHEEDGLEGVLGMVAVAQELPADAQHHRPVPRHQRGEGGLAGRIAAAVNRSRSWRSVRAGDRAALEERPDLPDNRPRCHMRHGGQLAR